MGERDDGLCLSLSLGFSQQKEQSPRSNQMTLITSSSSFPHMHKKIHHNSWPHLFQPSEATPVVSSPNSTVSSSSGNKRDLAARGGGDENNETERASCSHGRGESDDDDCGNGDGSRKKLRLSKEQALVLEETFKVHSTLNPKQKLALAKQLNLRTRQVEVWFQNRRARTKLKQTEVDCEYLKSCCDTLTKENRRLQKEVSELRALKLSPHLYMHMNTPPTTLTMCPSCQRVSVSSSSSAATVTPPPAASGHGRRLHTVVGTALSLQQRSCR